MVRGIDWFNEHLKEKSSPFLLDDRNLDLYELYMAKKSGKPNDDFPSKRKLLLTLFLGMEKS